MVKSINTKVDQTQNGTWFRGVPSYGKIMIGDKAFEFYNEKNIGDFVQIPWDEVTYVVADVKFKGKYIPRFEIRTKKNGNFMFAARDPKKALRAMSNYIPASHMRRSLSLLQGLKNRFSRRK